MYTQRQKYIVALLSVFSNGALVILKLVVGFLMGSISVISEAVHSGVDIIAATMAVFGVMRAGEPADEEHAYGHGKFESLSGLVQALLIFGAAGWIMWKGFVKLVNPSAIETVGTGVIVMFISAIVNAGVAQVLFRVGNKTDSLALKADAWHCWTDVYTSAGVMAGLAAVWLGRKFAPGVNLQWIDPVAAIAVALLIVKAAWDLTRQSLQDLLDVRLPANEEGAIKEILKSKYPRVRGFHGFRTRKAGPVRFVEFHLKVMPEMPVQEAHDLHHAIAREIKDRFPAAEVMVHIEPCNRECNQKCKDACFVNLQTGHGSGPVA
jgi:cation diffusion facilitator family transporter